MLAADDGLDLRDDGAVVGFNLGLCQLLFLQGADDGAIVGVGKPVLLGDERREGLHLVADFSEGQLGLLHEFLGRDIEADVLQVVGIDFGRHAVVGAGLSEDHGADPLRVILELRVEGIERGGRAVEFVDAEFAIELANAGGVARNRGEVFLHFALVRRHQAGGGGLGEVAVLGQRGDRRRARLDAGVALQASEGGGPARRIDLIVEQTEFAEENQLSDISVVLHKALVERIALEPVVGGLDEDFQIHAHQRIGLAEDALGEFVARSNQGRTAAVLRARGQVGDLVVIPEDAHPAGHLGAGIGQVVDEHLGIGVALGDPSGGVGAGGFSGGDESIAAEGAADEKEPPLGERAASRGGFHGGQLNRAPAA